MKNAMRITALSLLVVATLAGCFKGKVDLTLNEDNTIDGTMLIAIQSGVGESLGMSDDDLLGQLTTDTSDQFDGATTEDYSQDGYIGKVTTFTSQPLDAFSGTSDGSDIAITREGDLFIVDGTWDTQSADTQGVDLATLGAEFTFSVTFPGGVTESNGTVSGNTVTWNLLDPPDTIHAKGKATEGGLPWLLIILAIVAIAVIAAVVTTLLVVRKRRRGAEAAATEAPTEVSAPVDFGAPVDLGAPVEFSAPDVATEPPAPPAPPVAPEDPAAK